MHEYLRNEAPIFSHLAIFERMLRKQSLRFFLAGGWLVAEIFLQGGDLNGGVGSSRHLAP